MCYGDGTEMKKIIIGQKVGDKTQWDLPNSITLISATAKGRVQILWGGVPDGVISNRMAQELFQVILYPAGSVPSGESAWNGEGDDPKHTAKIQRHIAEEPLDIPRVDVKEIR